MSAHALMCAKVFGFVIINSLTNIGLRALIIWMASCSFAAMLVLKWSYDALQRHLPVVWSLSTP